jgi:cobalt-zinc-cadmium efflux system outer membrane protein
MEGLPGSLVRALLCAAHPMPVPRVARLRIASFLGASPLTIAVAFVAMTLLFAGPAGAEAVPPPVELPQQLSLEQALQLLRTRSLDLLIAESAVDSAEGDVKLAGAVPNPLISAGYARVFTYDPSQSCSATNTAGQAVGLTCSSDGWQGSLSDSAAIEDSLSGKRDLRLRVARAALSAAKLSRNDALRTLGFQVKSAYAQVAQAQRAIAFAKEVQATTVKTLELFRVKLKAGNSNDGEVARVETQKLEADQAVDFAIQGLQQARFALAFLLGSRGPVPEFSVESTVLDYNVPSSLSSPDSDRLLRTAFEHRPDLLAQGFQATSAQAGIDLARRQVFPDISLGVAYTQMGSGGAGTNGPLQPPMVTFSITSQLPIFYQQQGEIRKAEANYDTQSLQQAKLTAQVVSDVASALAAFRTSRALVERMERSLRPSAERAFSITQVQYDKNAATLMDLLDAQRTYIATNVEYLQDLANYWTAVFQVEEAVGMELRQ